MPIYNIHIIYIWLRRQQEKVKCRQREARERNDYSVNQTEWRTLCRNAFVLFTSIRNYSFPRSASTRLIHTVWLLSNINYLMFSTLLGAIYFFYFFPPRDIKILSLLYSPYLISYIILV